MKTKYKIEVDIKNRRYILTSEDKCESISFDSPREGELFHEFAKTLDGKKLEHKKIIVGLFNATVAKFH